MIRWLATFAAPAVLAAVAACQSHLPIKTVHNAASISATALASRTLAGSYERLITPDAQVSGAASGGLRWGAAGDYSSRTVALAGEARYWITGSPFRRTAKPRQMVGPYVGFRVGVAETRTQRGFALNGESDQTIGRMVAVSETVTVGYRLLLFRRLELTYSQGLQARHEFEREADLPAWSRFGLTYGLTVGAVF